MIDLVFERAFGLRPAEPECVEGCAGAGRCHGCMVWCAVCGDTKRVCDAHERCDRHRPLADAQIDALIRHWLLERGVAGTAALVSAVSDDADLVLPPPAERVRERLLALMGAGRIIVREGGSARWIGGVS